LEETRKNILKRSKTLEIGNFQFKLSLFSLNQFFNIVNKNEKIEHFIFLFILNNIKKKIKTYTHYEISLLDVCRTCSYRNSSGC
jgi:hypothetical protein